VIAPGDFVDTADPNYAGEMVGLVLRVADGQATGLWSDGDNVDVLDEPVSELVLLPAPPPTELANYMREIAPYYKD
jgi:hypothetical protein